MNRQLELEGTCRRIHVALGDLPADLVIRNVNLVNVHTEQVYPADVLISGDRIAALVEPGSGTGHDQIDGAGLFAAPGLLDSHVHIESSALGLAELARLIVPRGVTALFADPHEIANVLGLRGIELLLQDTARLPLRVFLQIPSRVPTAPGVETTGGVIGLAEVEEMLAWPSAASLGELDPAKVIPPVEEYILKVLATQERGKIANGHAPELTGRRLNAYVTAGIYDDHQCVAAEGAVERARLGMRILARQGKRHNLPEMLRACREHHLPTRSLAMCTDDKLPHEIVAEGHMDFAVRLAIRHGLPPVQAIQMASLNCAEHFHLQDTLGSVAPGRLADVVLLSSLEDFRVEMVVFAGRLVAQRGELLDRPPPFQYPAWAINTVRLARPLAASDLTVNAPASRAQVRVMDVSRFAATHVKKLCLASLPVVGGEVQADPAADLLKIAVVDRHTASGRIGLAFVRGIGLARGAIASSVAHDHHNIVVVGANDADMALAANHLAAIQGGFACALDGRVLADVPLRFGGLMSIEPYERAVSQLDAFTRLVREELGCPLPAPLNMLLGLSLPSVPEVGLTDMGMVQIGAHDLRPRFVDPVVRDDQRSPGH